MKLKMIKFKWLPILALALTLAAGLMSAKVQSAGITGSVATNRAADTFTYKVSGLEATTQKTLTLQVKNTAGKVVYAEENIALTDEQISNGTYTGTISHEKFDTYTYDTYTVLATVDGTTYSMGKCDFTIHQNKVDLSISGNAGDASRTVYVNSTEGAGGVIVPGSNNKVAVMAWRKGHSEAGAKQLGTDKSLSGKGLNWSANITTAGKGYGLWNAKLVLKNSRTSAKTLATATYSATPTSTSFTTKKSNSLEKKKSFQINLAGLKNAYGIKSVSFPIYNEKGKKAYTAKAKKKSRTYTTTVSLKSLKYKLQNYSIKAVVTDSAGQKITLNSTTAVNEQAIGGKLTITKKKNATTVFKLTGAYIPGNIKKIQYVIYRRNGASKKKIGTYKGKAAGKKYTSTVKNTEAGKYTVNAYGYTSWGKKILMTSRNYSLSKKNLGKQGWYYEKYNGKKYKFYYENNEKVTDLTKILKLKKNDGNRFYIELNRAACVVTIYMFNKQTNKFDIPVKTCTVCVGRDVSTNAGAGALNLQSSFTPIGNYSICTNGTAVRYTMKPMHEPDGSVVQARWCTHIVGNVYFHAIAVGSNTHYGLSPYKMNLLGSPASAGCVRMAVADAKWIFDYMPTGTKVKINVGNTKKPGPLGKEKLPKSYSVNYDPTDPGVPDSRKKKDYKAKRISGYLTKSGKKVGY